MQSRIIYCSHPIFAILLVKHKWVGKKQMTTKILTLKTVFKSTAALLIFTTLSFAASAYAITTLSETYTSSGNLVAGSLVSLNKNSEDHVTASSTDNANNLFGVVINNGNSLLTLGTGTSNQVQVATSGVEEVLVSDINGPVSAGDPITASPIAGVGMTATQNVRIIGIAQSDLKGTEQSYKDKNGKTGSAHIGTIPVNVNVSYFYKQPDKTVIPSALQNLANSLAGKKVNPLPIIISAGIFLVTLIVIASIVYSMIKSSIVSVGRNPMSQSAIYRDMVQMSALVVGIVVVAVVAIYLILTKL